MARVRIAPGREAPIRGRHPWVFSGAVAAVEGSPADGDVVDVVGADDRFLARGLFNRRSQIRVRLYTWRDEPLDDAFFASRIAGAVALRRRLPGADARDAMRLVFSEGDGLSGLTVDRYGDTLCVQLTSLALARRREAIFDALEAQLRPSGIVLRTEKGILEDEGLELADGVVRGRSPDGMVTLREGDVVFQVDLRTGQKTGFYLDQSVNRPAVARYAPGRSVADVCCYTGGFALHCAAGGARRIVGVDASERALSLARDNAGRNVSGAQPEWVREDAFRWLTEQAAGGARYDLVVLDPPRFARSTRGVVQALRAYRRLNETALRVLEPGGVLATFSCSGRVDPEAFRMVVGRAAAAAGRHVRIVERLGQPPDHPVSATCPETLYLKGLICVAE